MENWDFEGTACARDDSLVMERTNGARLIVEVGGKDAHLVASYLQAVISCVHDEYSQKGLIRRLAAMAAMVQSPSGHKWGCPQFVCRRPDEGTALHDALYHGDPITTKWASDYYYRTLVVSLQQRRPLLKRTRFKLHEASVLYAALPGHEVLRIDTNENFTVTAIQAEGGHPAVRRAFSLARVNEALRVYLGADRVGERLVDMALDVPGEQTRKVPAIDLFPAGTIGRHAVDDVSLRGYFVPDGVKDCIPLGVSPFDSDATVPDLIRVAFLASRSVFVASPDALLPLTKQEVEDALYVAGFDPAIAEDVYTV